MFPKLDFTFDDDILREKLIGFALQNYNNEKYFICNGLSKKRYFSKLLDHPTDFTEQILKSRVDFFSKLGITDFEEEPALGIFLGVNFEQGLVTPHTDPAPKNYVHTRINFLLSKPDKGGHPIIKNKPIQINENESWLNLASIWTHASTSVVGNKPRIVISYGALVLKDKLKELSLL